MRGEQVGVGLGKNEKRRRAGGNEEDSKRAPRDWLAREDLYAGGVHCTPQRGGRISITGFIHLHMHRYTYFKSNISRRVLNNICVC